MQSTLRKIILAAAAAAPALALATLASAQADTWDGGGTTDNWSDDLNWVDDTAPPLVQVGAGYRFGTTATQLVTDMDGPYSFGQLQFIGVSGYVINSSTGSTMSLSGFNNGQFLVNGAGNVSTVNVPILLNTLNTTNAASEVNRRTVDTNTGSVALNGTITANADSARNLNLRKLGAGTLTLGAANNLSGTFEINNGTVLLGNDAAFGGATVVNPTGNNIRIASTDAAARTLTNGFDFSGQGGVAFGPTDALGGTGNITVNGPITLGTTGPGVQTIGGDLANTTFNGSISGAGGLSKAGTGTLVLNGPSTFAGTTNVGNGILVVNGTSVSDTTVGGGILQGTGQARVLSVFGDTTVDGPEGTLSIADAATAGIFTAGRADFGVGGTYRLTLLDPDAAAGVGFDQLVLNGNGDTPNANLSVSATGGSFVIELVGGSAGFDASEDFSITIVDAADVTGAGPDDPFNPAGIAVDASGFGGDLMGGTFSVAEVGGDLNLVFTAVPEPASLALAGLGGLALLRRRR